MIKDKLKRFGVSEIFDIKKYPFRKKKKDIIYYQEKNGWCSISQYDSEDRCITYENSDGVLIGREYDETGKLIKLMEGETWKREKILNFLLEKN